MSDVILRIKNLTKTFRSDWLFQPIKAVNGVSLDVHRGEAFGFLGANGAGKTTTMKCIVGLVRRSAGEIEFEGKPLKHAHQRAKIGYLPEFPYFYDHLTVFETLDYFASLCGIREGRRARVLATLERVGLQERLKQKVLSLSKGLQQRLGFAQAIINEPTLLFLDEPFSGLDPIGRREFRRMILELRAQGTTLFLNSHILSDVENICDRVSIMSRGVVKHIFALKDSATMFGEHFELSIGSIREDSLLFKRLEETSIQIDRGSAERDTMTFTFSSYQAARTALHDVLLGDGRVQRFTAAPRPLEEIFVSVTGQALEQEAKKA